MTKKMCFMVYLFLMTFSILSAGINIGYNDDNIPSVKIESPTATTISTDTNVTTACEGGTLLLANGTCAAYLSGSNPVWDYNMTHAKPWNYNFTIATFNQYGSNWYNHTLIFNNTMGALIYNYSSVAVTGSSPWAFNSTTIYNDTTGVKVGIGISNPKRLLHVNGIIQWGGDSSAPYAYSGIDTAGLYIEGMGSDTADEDIRIQTSQSGDATNYIQFILDPTDGFSFKSLGSGNGNVGIGTETPTHELNVVGDVNVTGDLFVGSEDVTMWFYNMSDGVGTGNSSWNESRADLLYASIEWGYNQSLEVPDNSLKLTLANITDYYNFTIATYNQYGSNWYNHTLTAVSNLTTGWSYLWYNYTLASGGDYNYNHTIEAVNLTNATMYSTYGLFWYNQSSNQEYNHTLTAVSNLTSGWSYLWYNQTSSSPYYYNQTAEVVDNFVNTTGDSMTGNITYSRGQGINDDLGSFIIFDGGVIKFRAKR